MGDWIERVARRINEHQEKARNSTIEFAVDHVRLIIDQESRWEFKRLHDLIAKMRPVVENEALHDCELADRDCGKCMPCQARAVMDKIKEGETGNDKTSFRNFYTRQKAREKLDG